MRTLSIAAVIGTLALGGCTITQAQLDGARASYDATFLTPAAHYRQLGYCKTGTMPTLAHPCANRAVVAQLIAVDTQIHAQFTMLQTEIGAGGGSANLNSFTALQSAITSAQAIIATLPVK